MQNHEFLTGFNEDDVLSFCPNKLKGNHKPSMMKLELFKRGIQSLFQRSSQFETSINTHLKQKQIETLAEGYGFWFDDGVDCEVLRLGANQWRSGKIRIRVSVEFCPDEPEPGELELHLMNPSFPLDEIRRDKLAN